MTNGLSALLIITFFKQSSVNWAFDCPINFQNKVSQTKPQLHEYSTVGVVIHKFCSTKPVGLLGGPMAPRIINGMACGLERFSLGIYISLVISHDIPSCDGFSRVFSNHFWTYNIQRKMPITFQKLLNNKLTLLIV